MGKELSMALNDNVMKTLRGIKKEIEKEGLEKWEFERHLQESGIYDVLKEDTVSFTDEFGVTRDEKVTFADYLLTYNKTWTIAQLVDVLQNDLVDITDDDVIDLLVECEYLTENYEETDISKKLGLFDVSEEMYCEYGCYNLKRTIRLTTVGFCFVLNRIVEE